MARYLGFEHGEPCIVPKGVKKIYQELEFFPSTLNSLL